VAVLDADKEGFLRSERSLIQTIGRAARNLNGVAILYADQMTDSMKRAIDETERRRAKQIAFNEANGITPKGVQKKIKEMIDGVYSNAAQRAMAEGVIEDAATAKVESMSEKQISKEIKRLEKLMVDHAKNLEFEKAAQVRDQLHVLKQQAFGAPGADNVVSMLGK
jgi:excinuclease ABC subunit B